MPFKLSSPLATTAFLVSMMIALGLVSWLFPSQYGDVGTIDFVQYWRSWHLLSLNKNPYDLALAKSVDASMTRVPQDFIISWNPPWAFTLLSPALCLSFEQSATLWMLIQFFLLGILAITAPIALGINSPKPFLSAMAVASFFPALSSIYWGQTGLIIATSFTLFLFFQRRGSLSLAGLALLPLSIKPHLLYLLIIPGTIWLFHLRRGEAVRFLIALCGGFAVLVTCTCLVSPSSISNWVALLRVDPPGITRYGAVPFQGWQTTTLATWVRQLLTTDAPPRWPLVVIPLCAFFITAVYFLRSRSPIAWKGLAPALLCVSLITNNYGWVYDQSVLIVTQMAIVYGALELTSRAQRYAVVGSAFLFQIAAILLSDHPQHHFVWLPIALLCLLTAQQRLVAAQSSTR